MTAIDRNSSMTVELLNKIAITQGELQRLMIWASRLFDDLEKLKREVLGGT